MRLLLCDDHVMLLEALAAALARHGHEVVGTVTTPDEVAEAAERLAPDICIMDISFPTGDGLAALAELTARAPQTKVLMLSATSDASLVPAAFEAGAMGFVQKDQGIEDILAALHRIEEGGVAIDPRLLRAAMRGRTDSATTSRRGAEFAPQLTPREQQVLSLLVAGRTTAEIGKFLGVATSTARTHIQNVLVKLGVHSRLQAAAYAVTRGLVSEAEAAAWPVEDKQVRRAL